MNMENDSTHSDSNNLHPIITSDIPITSLFKSDSGISTDQRTKLMQLLLTENDDEFKLKLQDTLETNQQVQEVFTYLEEWRFNIKNLAFCCDKFKLDKYHNDIKKQSSKLVLRIQHVIDEIK